MRKQTCIGLVRISEKCHIRTMQRSITRQIVDAVRDGEVGLALPLTAEKGLSVILVLNQYK